MRVFVAGATGAIGRPLLHGLAAAGHEVTALTRSHRRAAQLRGRGFAAVVGDALDAAALRAAVEAARPEVVVHELTALPASLAGAPLARLYAATNRLRDEGTRNLLAAAGAAGARRVVAQSIAFAYRPVGGPVKDETAALHTQAPEPFGETVRVVAEMERRLTGAEGLEAIELRYGWLYGPGTYYARGGDQYEMVRRRRLPIVGGGGGLWSFVHVDDAARATVLALERGAPGIYNVVDDDPAPMSSWLPAYAEAIGARPPRRAPLWLARRLAPEIFLSFATTLRGAANAKARAELGFAPVHPSARAAFAQAL